MIYDLYFHDDFDGRAAGAVMLAFLRSRGEIIEHFQPINFPLLRDYLKIDFFETHKLFKGKHNPAIVVDFPFHPAAAWWFDHHGGPFRKAGLKEKFATGVRNDRAKFWHHDPEYASCCAQVAAVLKREFHWQPPAHLREVVRWGDIIDGAQYRSARQTIALKEPALQVAAFFDQCGHMPVANRIFVSLLAEKSLTEIARHSAVRRAVRRARREVALSLVYTKKNLMITGSVGSISFPRGRRELAKARYLPYFLSPKLLYLVRLYESEGLSHLGAGQNPWRKKQNKIDLGKLFARYGGGGHFGVGATQIKGARKAEKAMQEIVDYLVKKTKR